jgi:hypothetical protein
VHRELVGHRRLLAKTYRRYVDADLRLMATLNEMKSFFPVDRLPYRGTVGAPKSPIRRLREDRDQALLRFQSAYVKFKTAKARVHQKDASRQVMLLLSF